MEREGGMHFQSELPPEQFIRQFEHYRGKYEKLGIYVGDKQDLERKIGDALDENQKDQGYAPKQTREELQQIAARAAKYKELSAQGLKGDNLRKAMEEFTSKSLPANETKPVSVAQDDAITELVTSVFGAHTKAPLLATMIRSFPEYYEDAKPAKNSQAIPHTVVMNFAKRSLNAKGEQLALLEQGLDSLARKRRGVATDPTAPNAAVEASSVTPGAAQVEIFLTNAVKKIVVAMYTQKDRLTADETAISQATQAGVGMIHEYDEQVKRNEPNLRAQLKGYADKEFAVRSPKTRDQYVEWMVKTANQYMQQKGNARSL
jgi:hypothetical protein